jgi:hypothetical protein
MTLFTKITALAIACVGLTAPIALASSTAPLTGAETARLGAQTEAQGFKGIEGYLTQRYAEQVAQAGAATEAVGFKGIARYLEQRYGAVPVDRRSPDTRDVAGTTQPSAGHNALLLRSQALNRKYRLGGYSRTRQGMTAPAHRALRLRSEALNAEYRLGTFAPASQVGTAADFSWSAFGIGAAAMLGIALLAGGAIIGTRHGWPTPRTRVSS